MFALVVLALNGASDMGLRIFLLILVLIAVMLILAGGAIAALTFYYQRKSLAAGPDNALGE